MLYEVITFWFDKQKGFCEHYAGALVFLARAANIPARVVVGYQGAEKNPLSDYWIVRYANAHAWTEIWLEGEGWVRVDPTAAIARHRIEEQLQQEYRQRDSLFGDFGFDAVDLDNIGWIKQFEYWMDQANTGWNDWILDYSQDSQRKLFKGLGLENLTGQQVAFMMIGMLAAFLSLVSYRWVRAIKPVDPIQASLDILIKKLNRYGIELHSNQGVNALIGDIEQGGSKDALPLLAFTLECLYLQYGSDGDLTLQEYHQLGGIEGAIDVAVEKALLKAAEDKRLPDDRSALTALLRRGFIPWLAGIDSENQQPHRRVAKLHEIPEEAQLIIQYLVEFRLLATDVDVNSNEVTIEPAHEALLRQWGLLKDWLREDFASLTILESVQRASRDWEANLQTEDWLNHTTGRLEDAEKIKDNENLAQFFNQSDWQYLESCREKQDQQRNKELEEARKLAASQKKAILERDSALNTQNNFLMDLVKQENSKGNYDVAMLLGLNAVPGLYGGERPEPGSMNHLYSAVSNNRKLLELDNSNNTDWASCTPDGSKIVTITNNQQIIVWCSVTARKLLSFDIDYQPHHHVITPDGKYVLTLMEFIFERKYPILWSLETGEKVREFAAKCGSLDTVFNASGTKILIGNRLVYFHNDGQLIDHRELSRPPQYSTDLEHYLASPKDNDFQLNLLSVDKGLLKTYTFSEEIVYAAFIPGADRFVVLSNIESESPHGIVRVYSSGYSAEIQEFKVSHEFEKVKANDCKEIVFNPNGSLFIILGKTTSTLWIDSTISTIETDEYLSAGNRYHFNNKGSLLAESSVDGQITVRDGLTYNFLLTFNIGKKIDRLTFSPCSHFILTFSDGGSKLWEINTTEGVHRLAHQQDKGWLIFSPTGTHFLTLSESRVISLLQLQRLDQKMIAGQSASNIINPNYSSFETKNHLLQLEKLRQEFTCLWSNTISAAAGKLISISSSKGLSIWSIEKEIELACNETLQVDTIIGFSPDGRAVVAQNHHTIFFIDSLSMQIIWQFHGQQFARMSRDNQLIAVVSMGRETIIISMDNAEAIFTLEHQNTISDLCFSDEFIITTAKNDQVTIWSISAGQKIHSLDITEALSLSISPDGNWLLCRAENSCYLYSTGQWKLEHEMPGKFVSATYALPVFTKDNNLLLIEERAVSLWSIATGKCISLYAEEEKCYHCAITSAGRILAVASESDRIHQVSLWLIDTGELLTTYQYLARVDTVYFSDDSKSFLVTLQDGTTDYLQVYFDNLVDVAYQRLPINRKVLTPEERETYFLPKLTNEQWLKLGSPQYVI